MMWKYKNEFGVEFRDPPAGSPAGTPPMMVNRRAHTEQAIRTKASGPWRLHRGSRCSVRSPAPPHRVEFGVLSARAFCALADSCCLRASPVWAMSSCSWGGARRATSAITTRFFRVGSFTRITTTTCPSRPSRDVWTPQRTCRVTGLRLGIFQAIVRPGDPPSRDQRRF